MASVQSAILPSAHFAISNDCFAALKVSAMLYLVAACILCRQLAVAYLVVCASRCRYSIACAFSSAKPQICAVLLHGAGYGDSSCGSKDINSWRDSAVSIVPDVGTPSAAATKLTGTEQRECSCSGWDVNVLMARMDKL